MTHPRTLRATVFAAVFAVSVAALAQPSDADRATARALATEGNTALKQRDFVVAEDRFRRADALVHAPTLVVDHARALAGLGRLAEAYARYELVLREGVSADAPWAWKRALQDAEREIATLRPKLAWLIVTVKGPDTPRVLIDGRELPASELGTRQPADPGERTVTVSAPGFIAKDGKLTLIPGADAVLDVELVPDPEAREPEPAVAAPTLAPQPEARPARKEKDRTLAYVALGVGAAGLATGAVTGILALGARSDIESECPDLTCRPETPEDQRRYEDDASRYRLYGTLSGVGFALGLAGAGTGIALLLLDRDESDPKESARLNAVVGPSSVMLRGSF